MTHKRVLHQSLSNLADASLHQGTSALAEETLGYCLAQLRELRDQARRRLGLASLWAAFSDAWLFLAPDGAILDCNAGMANACGLPAEDLVGHALWDLAPSVRLPVQPDMLASVLELGRPVAFEAGAAPGWAEVYLQPLGPPGRPWAALVLVRHVGEWRAGGCLRRQWLFADDEEGAETRAMREHGRENNGDLCRG
jgi:PAS domain-containing protein